MTCNNCGKELEAGSMICTQCGFDNTQKPEEEKPGKINPWKIAFPATVALGLLLVLSWLLFYGVTGFWIPRANNIYYKTNYTVNEDQLFAGRDAVVATLGKHKLTNGQFQVFFSRVVLEQKGEYSASKPLDKQIYDEKTGMTWQQHLIQLSVDIWKEHRIMTDLAKAANFQLPEDYQESLDNMEKNLQEAASKNGYATVNEMLSDDICKGCTLEDYRYFVELNYYTTQYYTEMESKIEVSPDEIEACFKENEELLKQAGILKDGSMLADFRQIFIKVEESSDETMSDNWITCKNLAEGILNQWISGGAAEDAFAQLAVEKSQDSTTAPNGGLMNYVYKDYLTKVDVRHILILPEGGTKSEDGKTTVYSEAEWEACRQKAQAVYDTYLNGQRTEEAFSQLAKEHSKDGNASDGGIYTDVQKNSMVKTFDAWIFDESRKPGDTGLVKTEYGYHVMYFVHRDGSLNDWVFDSQREYGQYALVQSDTGYHVVFFIDKEETWSRFCQEQVSSEKFEAMRTELLETQAMKVKYYNIRLSE